MSRYLVEFVGHKDHATTTKSYTVEADSESSAETFALAQLRSNIFYTEYSWSVKRIQERLEIYQHIDAQLLAPNNSLKQTGEKAPPAA
ncbi:hypothetical protein HNQ86_000553 [Oleiagrimonas soli]|uniref:Uncharacterized protein n=1 Tax=Oleiagrimonas soli TaxID=1543381 RepID=A0A841KMC4_9GAMM|nr:hypothetical protein [Oleiagrimonas soli]